jgi:hypothetical protein
MECKKTKGAAALTCTYCYNIARLQLIILPPHSRKHDYLQNVSACQGYQNPQGPFVHV